MFLLPAPAQAAVLKYHVEYDADAAFVWGSTEKVAKRLRLSFVFNAPLGSTLDVTNFYTDRVVPTPLNQAYNGPRVSGMILTGVHMDGGIIEPDGTYFQPQYDVVVTTNRPIAFDVTLGGAGFGDGEDAGGLFELYVLNKSGSQNLLDNGLGYGEAAPVYDNGGSVEVDANPAITLTPVNVLEPATLAAAAGGVAVFLRQRRHAG